MKETIAAVAANHVFGPDNLPDHVKPTGYDRKSVKRGVVHVGPGGFFMAHFGAIIHDYMAASGDLNYGIAVASLRSPGTINALRKADNRYVLVEREGDDRSASLLSPIVETIFAPENPGLLVDAIADPSTKIVSMTITNKGYYILDSKGTLDASHHDIVHDLDFNLETNVGNAPRTVYWYLAKGLLKRSECGAAPVTIISLDNIPENSRSLKAALRAYIEDSVDDSARLLAWMDENVDFLTTLVDRITPEVTAHFRKDVSDYLGFEHGVVVGTEVFRQLVVEAGRFPVPAWEAVGVETVEDIGPFWELKFLGLNAGHQVPAMVGQRLGVTYIHEAMAIPELAGLLELFHTELGVILGEELMAVYGPKIQRRFKDRAPMDTIRRVGARGTSKASERILYAIERALAKSGGKTVVKAPTLVFACWLLNLGSTDEWGHTFQQDDAELHKLGEVHAEVLAWVRAETADKHVLAHILRKIGETVRDNRFVAMAGKDAFVTYLAEVLKSVSKCTQVAIRDLLES